ncbi:hypothetical protein KAH55_10745 [bacterium]|nr:hypothetical protein [bacterium]
MEKAHIGELFSVTAAHPPAKTAFGETHQNTIKLKFIHDLFDLVIW